MYGKNIIRIMPAIVLAGLFFCLKSITVLAYPLIGTSFTLKVYAMGKNYEFSYPEIDEYKGMLYLKNLEEVVDEIYYDTLQKPEPAAVKFSPNSETPFEFKKDVVGKCIDKENLLYKIQDALIKRQSFVKAEELQLKADVTLENLQKSTYRRSIFSTVYPYSSKERKENIELCAILIGGVMLKPYESFSFNQVVGERTEERGFKNAKVIEKGKFVDGIGGGVCQVSSTVYNAALLAGLTVTERHSHSMLVSYVEPSFDAMVSHGYADLKILNDTGGMVFITAYTKSDEIFVSVYGEKNEFSYRRVSVVKKEIECGEIERVVSQDVPKGEERFAVYPKNGAISEGFLEIIKNGEVVEKRLLSIDKYNPLKGVILYNDNK